MNAIVQAHMVRPSQKKKATHTILTHEYASYMSLEKIVYTFLSLTFAFVSESRCSSLGVAKPSPHVHASAAHAVEDLPATAFPLAAPSRWRCGVGRPWAQDRQRKVSPQATREALHFEPSQPQDEHLDRHTDLGVDAQEWRANVCLPPCAAIWASACCHRHHPRRCSIRQSHYFLRAPLLDDGDGVLDSGSLDCLKRTSGLRAI